MVQIWGPNQQSQGQMFWMAGLNLQWNRFLTWTSLCGFEWAHNRHLFILTMANVSPEHDSRNLPNDTGVKGKHSAKQRKLVAEYPYAVRSCQCSLYNTRAKKQPQPGVELLVSTRNKESSWVFELPSKGFFLYEFLFPVAALDSSNPRKLKRKDYWSVSLVKTILLH